MPVDCGIFVGNDAAQVRQAEAWLGRPVGSVLAYSGNDSWGACDPSWQIGNPQFLGGTGRRLRWSIPAWPENNSLAEMRSVARGEQFGRHQGWARACLEHRRSDNDPIYVRTAWEFLGEWFWWTGDGKADPGAFKAAVNNFYRAFKEVSPRFRTQWDFVPDRGDPMPWYPGDQFIDVWSQDVYWHPQYDGNDPVAAYRRHDTGLTHGLEFVRREADRRGKGKALPEWGVPGNNGSLNGAEFARRLAGWATANNCEFMDYWNSTSAYDGYLSDGQPAATAAEVKRIILEGASGGTVVPPPPPPPPPAPTDTTIGAGADKLVLKVSQDRQGSENARFTVAVDGVRIGGTLEAASARGTASDTVTVQGDWAAGQHACAVTFLNDAGGVPGNDRNLHVDGAAFNGVAVPNATRALNANGSATIAFTKAGTVTPPVDPPPPGGDPRAEVERLTAENEKLRAALDAVALAIHGV